MTDKTLSDDLADAIVDNVIADYEGRLSELACRDIAKRAYALGAGGAYKLSNGLTQAETDTTASVAGLSTAPQANVARLVAALGALLDDLPGLVECSVMDEARAALAEAGRSVDSASYDIIPGEQE